MSTLVPWLTSVLTTCMKQKIKVAYGKVQKGKILTEAPDGRGTGHKVITTDGQIKVNFDTVL